MFLKLLTLFSILLMCNSEPVNGVTAYGYHKRVGIPRADELLRSETLTRIVGGSQATDKSAFPYQAGIVTLLTTGWTSICGGSLISNTRVLSAAHCWWDGQIQAKQFTVVLGSLTIFTGGTRIVTSDVVVHPNWNVKDVTHDIAMVKISRVSFNNNIQVVPLPTLADVNNNFAGMKGTASGYGKTTDAQTSFPTTTSLHHTTLTILTNTVCQNSFKVKIHGSHLCTSGVGGVGTCDGDSGGPLVVVRNNQRILIGVVSFGLGDGCQSGLPSVFTRVTAFLPWIQANL